MDRGGVRIGTQQFLVLDLTMEVGAIEENITVTGASPLIETGNASQGTVLDSAALQTLPAPGRNAFMIGATVPTVVPSGDTQFNRQQDQTNASLLSLGGGTRRGNNYTLDGVPITDMRNRASANPTIEALEDVKVQVHTYDAEMGRTGGGVFNIDAASRAQTTSTAPASSRRGRSGRRRTTTSATSAGRWRRAAATHRRRRSSTSRIIRTISAAADSADPSSRTGRSSGSLPRTTPTSRRATPAS